MNSSEKSVSEEAATLLQDVVMLKIFCVEYFLQKIPQRFPQDQEFPSRLEAEIFIEAILFFGVAALDALYDEINKKLQLGIDNYYLTRDLESKLQTTQSEKHALILAELQKYNQKPTHTERIVTREYSHEYAKKYLNDNWGLDYWERFENRNGTFYEHVWNREYSSLWELRKLRNQITHGSVIKRSGEFGGKNRSAVTVHLVKEAHEGREMHFVFNPHEYFENSLNDIKKLVESIRAILNS